MRPAAGFGLFCLAILTSFAIMAAGDAFRNRSQAADRMRIRTDLVRRLDLTDLAWFTEGRAVRHPSQADRHAAFEDHPMALGALPAFGIVPPPPTLRAP